MTFISLFPARIRFVICEITVVTVMVGSQRSSGDWSQLGGLSKKDVPVLQNEALFQIF